MKNYAAPLPDLRACLHGVIWRDGAPANRAAWLEGLTQSPPLHVTHITGTVSGLRERPLSTRTKMAGQRNFLAASLFFLSLITLAASFQCIGLLFCTLLIQCKKIHLPPPSFFGLSHLS